MSTGHTSVQWNRHKKIYDGVLAAVLLLGIAAAAVTSLAIHPRITAETLIIRTTSTAALVLLHVILAIGPLARLNRKFLPLLYNRRHLGVTMFLLGLVHGVFALIQFHGFGDTNPLVSALASYREDYNVFAQGFRLSQFPFEVFGVGALVILFLMAATSHDFWLRNLGASWWKTLHLLVFVAYGLLLLHVTYGALQSEGSLLYPIVMALGAVTILGLHLAAALREAKLDRRRKQLESEGFVAACSVAELRESRGKPVLVGGERLAVFRHEGKIFALSNVCRHQGGPIGEGKIIDGSITCPWHGWQYRPEDGCSPPPFTEVVPTYRVALEEATVYVHPQANELQAKSCGIPVEQASREGVAVGDDPFYVGYLPLSPALAGPLKTATVLLALTVPLLMAALAWAQDRFDSGVFEFGKVRSFEGTLFETPLPMLRLAAPGGDGGSLVLLVSFGKFGLPEVAQGHHQERVAFDGSLIYRQGRTMIEMNDPESFRVLGPGVELDAQARKQGLGTVDLTGELVDTKCFLGVMRPAVGKVHRACAIRCLSGGIPPGLLVRQADGRAVVYVLAGSGTEPLDFDIQWAGLRVQVKGQLEILDDLPLLRVETLELALQ